MNLTLHIVRKDLVRMRVWIALWAGLLLAPIVIGAWFIAHNPFTEAEWSLPNAIAILTGIQVIVAYLLTILVFQEDGVVGTTQFWLTRPVSRGRMLVAKAISATMIVGLVPVAVSVPWWWWCGFGVGQMAAAAGETIVVLMIAILPGALVAVITDSFARALLWTVAVVAVLSFGGGFYAATMGGDQLLIPLRLIGTILVIAAELAVVVAVQFQVRRRGWWLAVAAGLIGCTLMLGSRGMWRPLKDFNEPREHDAARAPDLRVQFHRAEADPAPQRLSFAGPSASPVWQRVESQLVVSGLPRDLQVIGQIAKQRWIWPEGPAATRTEQFYLFGGSTPLFGLKDATFDEESRNRWLEQLEKSTGRRFAPGEGFAKLSGWLPPSLVARMRKEPPAFEARVWWQIARPDLQIEVPLAPGRWRARHGHGIGIERIERDLNFQITFVATRPLRLWPLLRSVETWYRDFEPDTEQAWALLDRERGVVTYTFGERHSDKPRAIAVNGVRIEWRQHFTAGPGKMRDGKWVADPAWRAGTSLAVFTLHDEAVISREVKVDRYVLAK